MACVKVCMKLMISYTNRCAQAEKNAKMNESNHKNKPPFIKRIKRG